MKHDHSAHGKPSHTFRDFLPLISIFGAILAFTASMVVSSGNMDLMYVMRMFMTGFFVIFGAFKLLKWNGFVMAYKKYDIIAKNSTAYAYAYPLLEISLGIAYFLAWNLLLVNFVTLGLMVVSTVGVWNKLRSKEEIQCACIGVVFKLPMTKVTLFENLLMTGMALVMIIMLL